MVVFIFFILDKDNKERFFEKNFLLANIKPNIIFRISFLTMRKTEVNFQAQNSQ